MKIASESSQSTKSLALSADTRESLQSAGLKATLPRLLILEILKQPQMKHATADDIYRISLKLGADFGIATVYRVLKQLTEHGLLTRALVDSRKARFELREDAHHDHLICLDCGHVEEFDDARIRSRQTSVAHEQGFVIRSHSLSLQCRCTRTSCPYRNLQSKEPFG